MPLLSFTTLATPELNGKEAIHAAAIYGFEGIDLRVSDYKGEITPESSKAHLNELKNIAHSQGVIISSLLCYNRTGGSEKNTWLDMQESVLRHLDIAEKAGAKAIRIDTGRPEKGCDIKDYILRSAETVLNVINRSNPDIDIRIQNHRNGLKVAEVISILMEVQNKRAGLIYSPEHCIATGENTVNITGEIKVYTRQVYIADIIKRDNEYRDILPGKGLLDIRKEMELIGIDEFKGFISFKWEKLWDDELEDYSTALPLFRNYIINAVKK